MVSVSTPSPALPVVFEASRACIDVYSARVRAMRRLLMLLAQERLDANAPAYAHYGLRPYVCSLVCGIRRDVEGLKPGSWCVAADIHSMPGDARDEFVHAPTYLGIAILSRFLERAQRREEDPHLPTGFWDVADQGLSFATLRRLTGHGYDGPFVAQDIAEIFAQGRVGYLLRQMNGRPGATAMIRLLRERRAGLQAELERSADQPLAHGFLEDVRPMYRETLWCLEDVLEEVQVKGPRSACG